MPRKLNRAQQQELERDAEENAAFYGNQIGTLDEEYPVRKSIPIHAPTPSPSPAPEKPLPDLREFDPQDQQELMTLLDDYQILKEQADAIEARMKRIKTQVADHCEAYHAPGLAYDNVRVHYRGMTTKSTLDKGLLLLNGCPAEAIAASYKEGSPFLDMTIRVLKGD